MNAAYGRDIPGDPCPRSRRQGDRVTDACPRPGAAPGIEYLSPYGKAAKSIFVRANGLPAYNRARGLAAP